MDREKVGDTPRIRSRETKAHIESSAFSGSSDAVTRREVLERFVRLVALTGFAGGFLAREALAAGHTHGMSTIPAGVVEVPAPTGFFSPGQKATIAILAELIIPADNVSPGAKAARIEDYIDFLVARETADVQQAWVQGLRAIDEWSRLQGGSPFAALPAEQQERLIAEIAGREALPQTETEKFFVRVKHATAVGFYTSKIGLLDDLKYQGNSYVEGPANCQDQFGKSQASACPAPGAPSVKRPDASDLTGER